MQETPIMIAACYGKVNAIEELIEFNANPTAVDVKGRDVMYYAEKAMLCSKEEKTSSIQMLQAYIKKYNNSSKSESVKEQADHFKTLGNAQFKQEK